MPTVYSPPIKAYIPLGSITLAASASSIVFGNISQDYKDLVLIATSKSTSSVLDQAIYFNSSTGGYTCVILWGTGSSYGSNTSSFLLDYYGSVTTDNTAATMAHIMDYSSTDKYTTWLSRSNRAASGVDAIVGRWANTDAVNSLTYFLNGGTLAAGSTVSLYGIKG